MLLTLIKLQSYWACNIVTKRRVVYEILQMIGWPKQLIYFVYLSKLILSWLVDLSESLTLIPSAGALSTSPATLSLYLSLNHSISLYLWEIEIELTPIITLPHQTTSNFLRTLELTYSQVWYIIGIVSSRLSYFCTENIGLIGVTTHLTWQQ